LAIEKFFTADRKYLHKLLFDPQRRRPQPMDFVSSMD
jgi:hypothetical protein